MPATNEEFIKKAFSSGLNESQVRAAVAERNQLLSQPKATTKVPGIQKVADFLGLGNTQRTGSSILENVGPSSVGKRTDVEGSRSMAAYNKSNELIKLAKQEKDPVKKAALIEQSRQIMQGSSVASDQFSQQLDQSQVNQGIGDRELSMSNLEFAGRRGAGTAAEVGSYILPGAATGARAATAGGRIAQGAIQGAISGGLQGVAGSAKEADTLGEAGLRTLLGTAAGTGMGAATTGAGELATKAFKPKPGTAEFDLSSKLNVTKQAKREGKLSAADRIRGSQFLKYKNKGNSQVNEAEVARVLDDIGLNYNNTDQLPSVSRSVSSGLQDIKTSSLGTQKGSIDVAPIAEIYKKQANRAILPKGEADRIFNGLVQNSVGPQGLKGASPLKADQLASEIGKEASVYYSASRDISGRVVDPAKDHIYQGLNAAKNYIRDQIDEKFASNISATPEQISIISRYSPKLAKAIQNKSISMGDLNYIQAMLIRSGELAADTSQAFMGAGQSVMGGRAAGGIPFVSQGLDVVNQAVDVAVSPLKSLIRTQTAKSLSSVPNLLSQIASLPSKSVGAVSKAGLDAKPYVINPSVAALQRMIDKENKSKQSVKRLP